MLPYKVLSANERSVEDSKSHSLHVKNYSPPHEPMSRSMQLNYIPVTAFS